LFSPYDRFRQRAIERWHFCHNPYRDDADSDDDADDDDQTRQFYSYYTGLEKRVKEVYLQNLFCSMQGVKISYPFAAMEIQTLIHRAQSSAMG
jgi:hypothetical protein